MNRVARAIALATTLALMSGCCATPYRAWQNARGWNDPQPDYYSRAYGPPRTTPPGPDVGVLPKLSSMVSE